VFFASLEMPADSLVVVVPDGPFQSVPWSAIADTAERPLIRKWSIVTSPSVSVAFQRVSGPPAFDSALIVGVSVAAGVAPLPGVRDEVKQLGRGYPEARLLLDSDATPEGVLWRAGSYAVIHIAAHAVDNLRYPLFSRVVLSDGAGGSRELSAIEITRRLSLPGSLVVLASCSSIGTAAIVGEGSLGLGWAFLRAGAGAVLGSVWELDDQASADLFADFHRHLRAGLDPPRALRLAQLAAIERGVPASVWAALQVFGRPYVSPKEAI
jgi:CHAT domain-containing protein